MSKRNRKKKEKETLGGKKKALKSQAIGSKNTEEGKKKYEKGLKKNS